MISRNFRNIKLWLVLPVAVLLYSCQQVVSIDLNQSNPQTVIEAVVTNEPGPYTVTITKTANYFETNTVYPPVTGAVVILGDGSGTLDTLFDEGDHRVEGIRCRVHDAGACPHRFHVCCTDPGVRRRQRIRCICHIPGSSDPGKLLPHQASHQFITAGFDTGRKRSPLRRQTDQRR